MNKIIRYFWLDYEPIKPTISFSEEKNSLEMEPVHQVKHCPYDFVFEYGSIGKEVQCHTFEKWSDGNFLS